MVVILVFWWTRYLNTPVQWYLNLHNTFSVIAFLFFVQRGFVSGSGDSTAKFWEFELVSDADHSQVRWGTISSKWSKCLLCVTSCTTTPFPIHQFPSPFPRERPLKWLNGLCQGAIAYCESFKVVYVAGFQMGGRCVLQNLVSPSHPFPLNAFHAAGYL